MDDLSRYNPQGRFNGRAALYARARPDYPRAAVDYIIDRCELPPGAQVVDVGAGTGISSRLMARQGMKVIGVEPNAEMRAEAAAIPDDGNYQSPEYMEGKAEATGLPDTCCRLVLAAQSFHWFKVPAALREFHRILQTGGWLCLMANERDESDSFTRDYGDLMRTLPDTSIIEMPRGRVGEGLMSSDLFEAQEKRTFENKQKMDKEALLGRAFSTSYAPALGSPEAESFAEKLMELYGRHESENQVHMKYLTYVYLGRKRKDRQK